LKKSKEIVTAVIALAAIALLVTGVNFLKGNSFFGGDEVYYAYFPTSGGVTPATSVYVNGVDVGKVLNIEYLPLATDSMKKVKITFNVSVENLKFPIGTDVEAGGIDLLTKGLTVHVPNDISKGYYKTGSTLPGRVSTDITTTLKSYADPLSTKLNAALASIDNMVRNVSAFWDTTATSELEGSLKEIKIAIKRFGNAAEEIELLVATEKIQLNRILSNVEEITANLKRSNEKVKKIVGNVEGITDDLVTADFKGTINNAKETLATINDVLKKAKTGDGTLGKLLGDETLYNELVKTNKELQNLVNDIQVHPERYIHFSVLGAKTKGVPLTNNEEQKLRMLLDSIP
jgi:phospholipid/cholesterol/gamma-HCH transport system substrate-binding protein